MLTDGLTFQSSNMKRHMRIHSDVRKFKCSYCPKAFKYINSWRYHEGIHTGKMLTCDKCAMEFRSKNGLRNHACDPSQYHSNINRNEDRKKKIEERYQRIMDKEKETEIEYVRRPGLRCIKRRRFTEDPEELGEDEVLEDEEEEDVGVDTADEDEIYIKEEDDSFSELEHRSQSSISSEPDDIKPNISKLASRKTTLGNIIINVNDEDTCSRFSMPDITIKKEPEDAPDPEDNPDSPEKQDDFSAVRVKLEVSEETGNACIVVESSSQGDKTGQTV